MSTFGWVVMGCFAGMHAATWGAYKDSPFEGFHWARCLRSIVLAVALAVALVRVWPFPTGRDVVVVAFTVYALERLATEGWKSILRENDQSSFTIPMRLAFRGRPVDHRTIRYAAGLLLLAALGGAALALRWADVSSSLSSWLVVVVVGGGSGWATAVGGAWKDAPIEGFSSWKFLRSPAVATAWAVPLSMRTEDWLLLSLASAGAAIATIETYKTFFTGDRPPGKFDGRPTAAGSTAVRKVAGCVHAVTWLALAAALLPGVPSAVSTEPVKELDTALGALSTQLLIVILVMGILRHTLRLKGDAPELRRPETPLAGVSGHRRS
ncbi:hypothetical protein [Pedococcus sp. 5OH_020]|uniref:hypothetical protein n=1 Tax=Pedococcus sp. 5OH_020 TaxID=2989814 RepID=UPI0022E99F99|nr:hypothetical protein [Pedococcus sp. 5OH_020]